MWEIIRLLIFFAVAFLAYFLGLRRYERYLFREYGYKLTGVPTIIAMVCFMLVSAASLFGIDTPMFDGSPFIDQILFGLLIGAPGILIATVMCYVKTRRPVLALVNIPLLYVYCFLAGYTVVFVVMLFFLGRVGGSMARSAASGTRTRPMTNAERIEHKDYWHPTE